MYVTDIILYGELFHQRTKRICSSRRIIYFIHCICVSINTGLLQFILTAFPGLPDCENIYTIFSWGSAEWVGKQLTMNTGTMDACKETILFSMMIIPFTLFLLIYYSNVPLSHPYCLFFIYFSTFFFSVVLGICSKYGLFFLCTKKVVPLLVVVKWMYPSIESWMRLGWNDRDKK